jgi:DNA-binding NarL/FixJ family response regulator
MRPLVAATTAELATLKPSDERRRAKRYRRHREAEIDSQIRKKKRDRELEAGLAVILDRAEQIPGYGSQVAAIVDRVEAGQSVAQIAQELVVHTSTVERRLRDVRKAAVASAEAEQLSGTCPLGGLNEGPGPNDPLYIEG